MAKIIIFALLVLAVVQVSLLFSSFHERIAGKKIGVKHLFFFGVHSIGVHGSIMPTNRSQPASFGYLQRCRYPGCSNNHYWIIIVGYDTANGAAKCGQTHRSTLMSKHVTNPIQTGSDQRNPIPKNLSSLR